MIATVAGDTDTTVVVGAVPTPLGEFGAVFTETGLAKLTFPGESIDECRMWAKSSFPQAKVSSQDDRLDALSEQLTAYLEGNLRAFSVPLDLRGTEFQRAVWNALLDIGYGEVRSYAAIANAIGRPRAVRAVGMANHANPVPVIVPCHRVIGSNGTLTGYGGGLDLKERLLRLEGALLDTSA